MKFLEEVSKALNEVIKWPGMAYSGLCDTIGISEWAPIFVAIGVILAIAGIAKLRR